MNRKTNWVIKNTAIYVYYIDFVGCIETKLMKIHIYQYDLTSRSKIIGLDAKDQHFDEGINFLLDTM